MFKGLAGKNILRNVVFVTNKLSSPPSPEQKLRQKELEQTDMYFGAAIKQGARVFCNLAGDGSRTDLADTAAGMQPNKELRAVQQQHQKEMARIRNLMEAVRQQDWDIYNALEVQKREAQRKLDAVVQTMKIRESVREAELKYQRAAEKSRQEALERERRLAKAKRRRRAAEGRERQMEEAERKRQAEMRKSQMAGAERKRRAAETERERQRAEQAVAVADHRRVLEQLRNQPDSRRLVLLWVS